MKSAAMPPMKGLGRMSQPAILGVSLLLVVMVAAADVAVGAQVGFSIFYVMPVLLAAWVGTRGAVLLTAVLAGAAYPVTEIVVGVVYRSAWIPYWNFASRSSTYLIVGFLAHSLKSSLQHEQELARTDSLTGALNTRSFYEIAMVEVARARRGRSRLTVAYLDLDGFKAVND
jgi:predicted signal transduction protein with EAL and GGDEF domain